MGNRNKDKMIIQVSFKESEKDLFEKVSEAYAKSEEIKRALRFFYEHENDKFIKQSVEKPEEHKVVAKKNELMDIMGTMTK